MNGEGAGYRVHHAHATTTAPVPDTVADADGTEPLTAAQNTRFAVVMSLYGTRLLTD